MPNVYSILRDAELHRIRNSLRPPERQLQGHSAFARRLAQEASLVGHDGCVNRLSFSPCGSLLASASDDTCVILWDVLTYTSRKVLRTEHSENIFGVRIMPHSGNTLIATGAMDSEVRVTHLERETSTLFFCHTNRVKTVDVDRSSPHLLWSCSEDATVRQFDLRQPHLSRPSRPNLSNVLINMKLSAMPMRAPPINPTPHAPTGARYAPTAFSADSRSTPIDPAESLLAIGRQQSDQTSQTHATASSSSVPSPPASNSDPASPALSPSPLSTVPLMHPRLQLSHIGLKAAHICQANPNYLIVAGETVRIFDRRTLSSSVSSPAGPDAAVEILCPSHLRPGAPERTPSASSVAEVFATHAAFSDCGTRAIASFYGDHVYVFDLTKSGVAPYRGGIPTRPSCVMQRPRPLGWKKNGIVQDLIRSARSLLEKRFESTALPILNQTIALDPHNVLALHMRCEALLRRGWVSDYRDALSSSEELRDVIANVPSSIDLLVNSSLEAVSSVFSSGAGSSRAASASIDLGSSARRTVWLAVLELQRVAATFGMILPRGHVQHSIAVRCLLDHQQYMRDSLLVLTQLEHVADMLDYILKQLSILYSSGAFACSTNDIGDCMRNLFCIDQRSSFYRTCLTTGLMRRLIGTIDAADEAMLLLQCIRQKKRGPISEPPASIALRRFRGVNLTVGSQEVFENGMTISHRTAFTSSPGWTSESSPSANFAVGSSAAEHRSAEAIIESRSPHASSENNPSVNVSEELEVVHGEYDEVGEGIGDDDQSMDDSHSEPFDTNCPELLVHDIYGNIIDDGHEVEHDDDESDDSCDDREMSGDYDDARGRHGRIVRVGGRSRRSATERTVMLRIADVCIRLARLTNMPSRLSMKLSSSDAAQLGRFMNVDTRSGRGGGMLPLFVPVTLGYSGRYVGHCNVETDIKEANFYGSSGQCVISGSDDGFLHVWCTSTGRLLARLEADQDVLNCVQSAPQEVGGGLIATSGIESDVKLWAPVGDDYDMEDCADVVEECFRENWAKSLMDSESPGWRLGFSPFDGSMGLLSNPPLYSSAAFDHPSPSSYHSRPDDDSSRQLPDCRVS